MRITKNLILAFFLTFISFTVEAGTGAFPQGDAIKQLKDKIKFRTNTQIITGDADDPTVTAKDAIRGSWYVESDTGEIYVKQDNGLSTNWKPIVNAAAGLTQGSVPYVDSAGSLTEDNANFFYDELGPFLGIGTNTPNDTLDVNGTFDIGNSTSVSSILDEDTLVSDSDTALATQQSIKAYADSNVTFTPDSIPFADGTTGKLTEDNANLYYDDAAGSFGVNAFTITDNVITDTTGFAWFESETPGDTGIWAIASANASANEDTALRVYGRGKAGNTTNSEYLSMQWETSTDDYIITTNATGTGTLQDLELRTGTNQDQIFLDASSGNVGIYHPAPDNTLDVNGTFDIGDTTSVDSILDEDDMLSDSATALATQQSIKAYVDNENATQTHNSLVGLQGGAASEYYHLPQAEHDNLVDVNAQLANLHTDGTPTFGDTTIVGDIIYSDTGDQLTRILADTLTGSDDMGLIMAGGGAIDPARGAQMAVYGTDHATNPGKILMQMGTATGSEFSLLDDTSTEVFSIQNLTGLVETEAIKANQYIDLGQYVNCDDPAASTGRLFWCQDDDIPYFYDGDNELVGIGRDITRRVKNVEGATINRGDVVFVSGSSGQNPEVELATANSVDTSTPLAVVKSASIADNGVGKVALFGRLLDVDTTSYTTGDILYLSTATPGELTATETSVRIGVVINSLASGEISIDIQPELGGRLEEFEPNKEYFPGDTIYESTERKIYLATTNFTSGGSFDETNWEELSKAHGDLKNLVFDPSFEYGANQGTCTGCTVSYVSETGEYDSGNQKMRITSDGTSWDWTLDFPYTSSGDGYIRADISTSSDLEVEVCQYVDSTEGPCKLMDDATGDGVSNDVNEDGETVQIVIPTATGSTRYGLRIKDDTAAASETLDVHLVEVRPQESPEAKDSTVVYRVRAEGNGGESITANTTPVPFTELIDDANAWDGDTYTVQRDDSKVKIEGHIRFSASADRTIEIQVNGTRRYIYNVDQDALELFPFSFVITDASKGDTLEIIIGASGGTLVDSAVNHYINITEQFEVDGGLRVPDNNPDGEATSYNPTTQGFGTLSNSDFNYWTNGEVLTVQGRFEAGTPTASEAQIGLPSGMTIKSGGSLKISGTWIRDGASGDNGGAIHGTPGDAFMNFSDDAVYGSSSNTATTSQNGDVISSAGSLITVFFTVPIEELSAKKTITATVEKNIIYGQEQYFGERHDGAKVYQYCNEVSSDITTTDNSYDTSLPSGLNPVESLNFTGDLWVLHWRAAGGSSNNISELRYNRTSGNIEASIDGTFKVGAGTVYCMKYTKP